MSVKLKPHNQQAYEQVKNIFEKTNRAAIIHPTGTGKSYIALKLIEDNKEKNILYLAPSNSILHQIKKISIEQNGKMFSKLKRMTYQKLSSKFNEQKHENEPDIIILDEFHHCGAPIWGEAVLNLCSKFPNAKVLGLSATPIRYFDGNIDMAEEMFGENIASEISFTEAIEKEILPGFDYISAMYKYEDKLLQLKEEIENSNVSQSKKVEAKSLFNELSKQLSKNTEGLPEILQKHMTNKNGKYMIFCSNIEEMKKKIQETQELFSKINPNINIYSVSSLNNLKRNQKTLKQFENDNDENSLKLMFSINMLNEGYHLPDIDGVIMMRPTKSPTIYLQQIGRALTIKNSSKRPVIIDLVDNFDSIQIIENFTKTLSRECKSTSENIKNSTENKGFEIIDYTKSIGEISKKIEKLTKLRSLSMSEKIDLFEKFLNENDNEVIHYDTIFEGYPIGVYLIQIRQNMIYNKNTLKYNDLDKERLENLGLLDNPEESINDKIISLKDFCEKYPYAISNRSILIEKFKKEGKTQEIEQIENLYKSYLYILSRRCDGKISEEIENYLQESKIGGVFCLSKEESQLAEKYNIKREEAMEIGFVKESIEELKKLGVKDQEIKEKGLKNIIMAQKIVEDYCFEKEIGRKISQQEQRAIRKLILKSKGIKSSSLSLTINKFNDTQLTQQEIYGFIINTAIKENDITSYTDLINGRSIGAIESYIRKNNGLNGKSKVTELTLLDAVSKTAEISDIEKELIQIGVDEKTIEEKEIANLFIVKSIVEKYNFKENIGRNINDQEKAAIIELILNKTVFNKKSLTGKRYYFSNILHKLEDMGLSVQEIYGMVINIAIKGSNITSHTEISNGVAVKKIEEYIKENGKLEDDIIKVEESTIEKAILKNNKRRIDSMVKQETKDDNVIKKQLMQLGIKQEIIEQRTIDNLYMSKKIVDEYDFEKVLGRKITEEEQCALIESILSVNALGKNLHLSSAINRLENMGLSKQETYGFIMNTATKSNNIVGYSDFIKCSRKEMEKIKAYIKEKNGLDEEKTQVTEESIKNALNPENDKSVKLNKNEKLYKIENEKENEDKEINSSNLKENNNDPKDKSLEIESIEEDKTLIDPYFELVSQILECDNKHTEICQKVDLLNTQKESITQKIEHLLNQLNEFTNGQVTQEIATTMIKVYSTLQEQKKLLEDLEEAIVKTQEIEKSNRIERSKLIEKSNEIIRGGN